MQSAELTTYMTESCTMPFCKGCGHSHVLRKLDEALVNLQIPYSDVALVTDIGCIGLADGLFPNPHTVHTTHGRSTAFATGIQIADGVLGDRKLKTIVLIGDGGAMIGLLHLVHAALLNADVTVLLCNNFLFGMTGGQNSAFSPLDFVTATSPKGNMIPPLDLCRIVIDAHAGYVARKLATDKDLPEVIANAISHPGFALVEIVELCTEYGTPRNKLGGAMLEKIVQAHGQELGVLSVRNDRSSFDQGYREKALEFAADPSGGKDKVILQTSTNRLREQIGIVVAGSAGEKIQSAARRFCEAAIASGLHCTQKNDNPVTQGTGFSASEIVLSPREIHYTGIDTPHAVVVVSVDGLNYLRAGGVFSRLTPSSHLIADEELDLPPTDATIHKQPFRKVHGGNKAASAALAYYLEQTDLFPKAPLT